MQKLMFALLIGIIALTPAIVAAQTGGGSTGAPSGSSSSPSGTSGSPSTSAPSSGGATTAPGAGGSASPSASPSGSSMKDFTKFHTKADCEKAGGMWQTASSSCTGK
jgi:hypothetical protein